jgi:hypothetical protein
MTTHKPGVSPEVAALLDKYPQALSRNSKWVAKLSFVERCQAVAAVKGGMLKKMVALAFGVNVSTLEFMLAPNGKHYKDVKRELRDLGEPRFIQQYYTPEVAQRVLAFIHDPRLAMNQKVLDKEVAEGRTKVLGADRRADHAARTYTTFSNIDGTMHVEIAYVLDPGPDFIEQTPRPEGWYARILSTSPDWKPLHKSDDTEHGLWYGTNGSWMTSKKALENFLADTMAEVIE